MTTPESGYTPIPQPELIGCVRFGGNQVDWAMWLALALIAAALVWMGMQ